MDDCGDGRVAYRIRSQMVMLGSLTAIYSVLVGSEIVGDDRARLVVSIVVVVLALAFLAVGLRATFAVLVVDGHGVMVRGAFRTSTVPWQDITEFSIGRYRVLGYVLLVHRSGQPPLPVLESQPAHGAAR